MLYAATKSALNSLCKSAEEYFVDSKVSIKIYNPSTFGGKHLGRFVKKSSHSFDKFSGSFMKVS